MKPQTRVLGTGHAVPAKILRNADLETMVDTSDAWIRERTGIRERHIAEPGSPLSELAASAARQALEAAGLKAQDIDLIIVATVSGDMKFPATACFVQKLLGNEGAAVFDLSAACSGFIYGLQVASSMLQSGAYKHALVIGGEILSSMVDWQDRNTCVLFGDGAGAVVLGPGDGKRGLLHTVLGADGRHSDLLYNPGGGCLHPPSAETVRDKVYGIRMAGREVFRNAVTAMSSALQQVLAESGLEGSDLDLLIPHQANRRIMEAVAKRFGIPMAKVYSNVEHYGNTSAASTAIALDEAVRNGRIREGDTVGLVAFGAGFTWGAAILRF